jgi:hypothetical protein
MHPFGPRVWGPHDGESGPGLLSQAGRPCCRLMHKWVLLIFLWGA